MRRLEDKAPGRVERIHPAYTSQTCSRCGHCVPGNRESQAFRCRSCGYRDHADVNAAINIAAGRAVSARGGRPTRMSVKREPQPLYPRIDRLESSPYGEEDVKRRTVSTSSDVRRGGGGGSAVNCDQVDAG
ncbi:transposase [Kribbella soli]